LQAQNYFTFADVAIEQKLYSKAIFKENSIIFGGRVSISSFLKNLFIVPVATKERSFFAAVGVRFIGSPHLVLSAGFEAMASPTAKFKIVRHLAQDPNRKLTLRGQKQ